MLTHKFIRTKRAMLILAFFIFTFIAIEMAAAATLTFRYSAVNPSATKKQAVTIKKYLPVEVTPADIIDAGGLEVEYDEAKALYYVYKNNVELAPKEIRNFEVEVNDIWMVPEYKLSELKGRTEAVLTHLEGTEFYAKAKEIADTIYPRVEEIRTSQMDDTISKQRHIGAYRQNLITKGDIENDIARMEKILVTAGGPPAPEMLAESKIKAEAPTKTMTWIVIFVIIIFLGLLGGVMFFTWHQQSRITKETLSASKNAAFPSMEMDKGDEAPPES